jgi:hypothetical protein
VLTQTISFFRQIFAAWKVRPWTLVAACYILLYGYFLFATDSFPYATDNNESFSSLVHARNLATFDFLKSYGLTDESYANTDAGHPYIHSHQGNFPRLFAFLLYVIGARSVESQIWLTTFTIGLIAVWLAFRFARRLGGTIFGLIACLLLMTDYEHFAQWQVNTYRVWHVFFFFSSLECVYLAYSSNRRLAWLLAVVNFAGLFYWEYVFAAFVGLTTAIYAALVHRNNWRAFAYTWSACIVGAGLAAGTLLAQLTAYMGWSNVLRDIRYTMIARNSSSDSALAAEINAFYDQHNILFWQNYLGADTLRSWDVAWSGILNYQWRYSGPIFVSLALMLVGALLFFPSHRFAPIATARKLRHPFGFNQWLTFCGKLGVLTLSFYPLVCRAEALVGTTLLVRPFADFKWLAPFITWGFSILWTRHIFGAIRLSWVRLVTGAVWAYLANLVLADLTIRFGGSPALEATGPMTGTRLGLFAGIWALVTALALVTMGPAQVLGRQAATRLRRFLPFVVATTAAFAGVYFIFTGYIYSGYLHRKAPLLVFALDFILALAAYISALAAFRFSRQVKWVATSGNSSRSKIKLLIAKIPFAAAALFCAAGIAGWFGLQKKLIQQNPPLNQRYLLKLKQPPFRGESFAVTTYAAPVAVNTGSWAYFESTLFSGQTMLRPNGWQVPRDHQYLWFADRATNPDYDNPSYALIVGGGRAEPDALILPAESTGLFQRARTPFQPFLRDRVVDSDRINYSIIKLDWDYPPYLKLNLDRLGSVVGSYTLSQKLALRTIAQTMRRRWNVSVETAPKSAGSATVLLEAQIDGHPVFTASALKDAGWQPIIGKSKSVWSHINASSESLSVIAIGDILVLNFQAGPQGGKVVVSVNDRIETLDLNAPQLSERRFVFSANQAFDRHTFVPVFSPGLYVETTLLPKMEQPTAEVRYRFNHQKNAPEAGTLIRIYAETDTGEWRLADSITFLGKAGLPIRLSEFRRDNPRTVAEHIRAAGAGDSRTYEQWLLDHLSAHPSEMNRPGIVRELLPISPPSPQADHVATVRRVRLPQLGQKRLQISVTPGTSTKLGPEYFGLPFTIRQIDPVLPKVVPLIPPSVRSDTPLPFGSLKLRLRFPPNRWPQSEPLVSTGIREAGDFVHVIYVDRDHIKLGFDHWFKGGPLSRPLKIDFGKEHELDISIGSLFPSEEDIVFAGWAPAKVTALKQRVLIKLDGQTIIDAQGECYESNSGDVTVGRNEISGTSAGPIFTGKILSIQRVWP